MRVVLLSAWCLLVAFAQDCNTGGKWCTDHEQCCGGCCINGECVNTYRLCTSILDVCEDHTCLGEESCVPYSPPQCMGCEPVPVCMMI